MNDFTLNNEACQFGMKACRRNSAHMLPVTDYLADLPKDMSENDLVEVQFKNTRKAYYRNTSNLPLEKGMTVAVEGNPGHDIGEVSLTGPLVAKQMQKYHIDLTRYEIRQVYRIASDADIIHAQEAHEKEHETMIKARQLAASLGLEMKIGDVEYQGDGNKAIFYYIADGRVDFRQLIKVYAETFRVRIEMKQIGARQEAGRIGGTGPCGRELCCSTWMTQFNSVGTGAARIQNISPNPQKLAGMCAKLKCCLNYEVPTYEEANAQLPDRRTSLQTQDGEWYFFSADPLAKQVTYSSDPRVPANLKVLSIDEAKRIIAMNKQGQRPATLVESNAGQAPEIGYLNVVGQDDVHRFDKKKKNHDKKNNNHHRDDRRDRRPKHDTK